jgi:predicted  nucleic acid-binding Zn-ribbon protein
MDPKFLEWFGQLLILSAKNIDQAQKFLSMFKEGMPEGKEAEEWLEPYLTLLPKDSQNAAEELQKLFNELFENMGVVSRKEHQELLEKYGMLQSRIHELEKTIMEIRSSPSKSKKQKPDLFDAWTNMLKSMGETNARLMEQFQKIFIK